MTSDVVAWMERAAGAVRDSPTYPSRQAKAVPQEDEKARRPGVGCDAMSLPAKARTAFQRNQTLSISATDAGRGLS
ncbi:hypothetical protein NS376_23790 [Pseudomonas oryzihabitans]|nr:hypothetical protein NS376_23790 [Pseudomonas psychrotolerans]